MKAGRSAMLLLSVLGGLLLAACEPAPPIRIGFIGGLSDRNSDNGQAGLNAVILAVETFNRDGGMNGRSVELLVRDDAQDGRLAARSARELVEAGVEAVIGPFSSEMAKTVVPIFGAAGIFEVSPTVSSMDFYGKDDNLFRVNRTTRDNARDYARVLLDRGQRRIAVAYDIANRNFTESWLAEFRQVLHAAGHKLAAEVPYTSAPEADFGAVISRLIASRPDGLLFISGALDVVRLTEQARRQAPRLPVATTEWAATEQLLEAGGQGLQHLLIAQSFDRDADSPNYRAFSAAYAERFQQRPGYSAVAAYDAATVVLSALRQRAKGEPLKSAALRSSPYEGLQQRIVFDANGDTERRTFFFEVREGRFTRLND